VIGLEPAQVPRQGGLPELRGSLRKIPVLREEFHLGLAPSGGRLLLSLQFQFLPQPLTQLEVVLAAQVIQVSIGQDLLE
jgi:hypothetical protein